MKKTGVILLAVSIAIAGLWWIRADRLNLPQQRDDSVEISEQSAEGVSLVIDYGEGKISTYSAVPAEGSVLDILKSVAGKEGISLETKEYDFGVMVTAIAGRESSAERAWIYFVNGESGAVAADKNNIKAGDVVEWRYIEPN